MRESGLLLPVFSLPGPYGIGTLGRGAFDFVDFLVKAGQRYWQVLPMTPTGYGDSPYQSCSAFAGNPYFIDLDLLAEQGLLQPGDYQSVDFGQGNPDCVDYEKLYAERLKVLRVAYERGKAQLVEELAAFEVAQRFWLADYALFMAVKTHFGMVALQQWPDRAILRSQPDARASYGALLADEVGFQVFMQYCFFTQWAALKAYANSRGVLLIGDMPIYVSADSAEVWAKPELFMLDAHRRPTWVAGVPPDLFSATGQLWGNPLYRWKHMEHDGYSWWIERVRHEAARFDVVRIDHFRGFESYWAVPAAAETAMEGKWRKGPAMKWFEAVRRALPDARIVAEDLGILTPAVFAFLENTGLPGLRLLVYGFDAGGDSIYLPHNIIDNCVAYTSNHDSPTFLEWLTVEATPEQAAFATDYLRLNDAEGLSWGAVKSVWGSCAHLAIAAFQDVLGLGGDARINTPSTLGNNWRWRVRAEAMNGGLCDRLRHITAVYRRNGLR